MRIKKCKVCGFPYRLARSLVWNDNGTITSKHRPDFRTLIIEADYLTEIFKKIEEVLGVSNQHIVFEAQRNAAKDVINGNISRFRWAIRYVPGVRRMVIAYFNRMASWTGQAYAKTIPHQGEGAGSHRSGSEIMARRDERGGEDGSPAGGEGRQKGGRRAVEADLHGEVVGDQDIRNHRELRGPG